MSASHQPPPLAADEPAYRFGPLLMLPGVSRKHVWTLFFISFFGIAMMNTVGILQAYLFNEILRIPPNEQGALTGTLLVTQELVVILLVGLAGAISDRLGRPPVFAVGFSLLAIGYCLYPLASGDLGMLTLELVFFRLFIASGVACINVMLSSVANDYPVDANRAKMIAAVFVCNGLGIGTLPRFIGGLPQSFIEMGMDPVLAGRMTYWCVAGICVFLALVLLWGLKPGPPVRTTEREPLLATLRVGLNAARMPRVALGYAAAFVSRADLAVVSQFLTLWLVREGMAQGLTVAQATLKATTFYVVIQLFALPWAVIFGIVLDRIDRLVGLAIGMSVAFVGYASLGVLDNPIGNGMYIAAAFVGAGEMAANISATSLIGKEAPERGRGAVLGLFSLFGAVGIMVVGLVGGWLFDNWKPVGPFLYMAASNATLFLLALLTIFLTRKSPAAA
ncbi:MAG: MFS transporter [Gammaproteobacteria bacterium]|nr:MFS transporter [Gammaproteobacteria bacterium]